MVHILAEQVGMSFSGSVLARRKRGKLGAERKVAQKSGRKRMSREKERERVTET